MRNNNRRKIVLMILLFLTIFVGGSSFFQRKKLALTSSEAGKKIALTFDDGPHPYYTLQLLNGLKEKGVKATFFVLGEQAEQYPDIIEKIAQDGHLIGNHTYSHMQLTSLNREAFKQELKTTSTLLKNITKQEIIYVRPPYGIWDKALEKELNMFPVMWSLDTLDWCSKNVSNIEKNVLSKVKENDIILMHDYYESSVTAALELVEELQKRGYVFVTIDEILFD